MRRLTPTLLAAGFGAAAMIANQVGGKATRDALFLSSFPVSTLPMMVIISSLLSIAAGLVTARLMTTITPSLLMPRLFLLSSLFHFIEWRVVGWSDSAGAVFVYLHIAMLGPALTSGFWSLLDDRFDARTARKQFGRIVAAGTFGGLIGGFVAERVGSSLNVGYMLPVLALFHLLCAFITTALAPGCKPSKRTESKKRLPASSLKTLVSAPYVRNLALLILLSTLGAGMLDYVFKLKAAAVYAQGPDLVRFFGLFYAATGVATFLVQSLLSRVAIERLGIAGAVSSLPLTLAFGSVGTLVFPGLSTAFTGRAAEAVFRTSFFKSGYEMLYAAVPRRERRATKTIVDVGVERLGDLLSALLLGTMLLAAPNSATTVILICAAGLGLAGFWVSRSLRRGYVQALEGSLLSQTVRDQLPSPRKTDRTVPVGVGLIARESIIHAVQQELDANAEPDIEHIFRLLELVFPREPMQIAQRAMRFGNDQLKGTSLEYLENVLPPRLYQRLLPLF